MKEEPISEDTLRLIKDNSIAKVSGLFLDEYMTEVSSMSRSEMLDFITNHRLEKPDFNFPSFKNSCSSEEILSDIVLISDEVIKHAEAAYSEGRMGDDSSIFEDGVTGQLASGFFLSEPYQDGWYWDWEDFKTKGYIKRKWEAKLNSVDEKGPKTDEECEAAEGAISTLAFIFDDVCHNDAWHWGMEDGGHEVDEDEDEDEWD